MLAQSATQPKGRRMKPVPINMSKRYQHNYFAAAAPRTNSLGLIRCWSAIAATKSRPAAKLASETPTDGTESSADHEQRKPLRINPTSATNRNSP